MEKADASWLDLILPLSAGSNRQGAQAVELLLTVDVQGLIMYDTIRYLYIRLSVFYQFMMISQGSALASPTW